LAKDIPAKTHEVAVRALTDPQFASELRRAALAAVKGGAASQAFRDYFEHFASTPGELAGLGTGDPAGCTCNSNTWFTLSSMVGPIYTCCATTTTTTTSGDFFGQAGAE
jgi:hypothetical protein